MKPIVYYALIVSIILLSSQSSGVKETLDAKLWYQLEVEKVAMDYYDAMYEKWKILTFRNLSRSEKQHMQCMDLLINEVGDPKLINLQPVGKFNHKDLQELFNKVMVLGEESENKAFLAAANLEEKNIKDVENLMELLKNENSDYYLTSLFESSKCHLNIMVCQLKNRGVGYKPVLLTLNEYIDCLESTPGDINTKLTNCPEEEYKCPFDEN